MSAEERHLVFKLDCLILIYACLSFFTKYLDVSALSMYISKLWLEYRLMPHTLANAYVSGMKEDLHLTGNRLNYINAACKIISPKCLSALSNLYGVAVEVGYVVFQVPSNILITKIPAHIYLPAVEVFWGLFTLGTAFVTSYEQLVVMRFFVGLSSTACYIGCLTVISS